VELGDAAGHCMVLRTAPVSGELRLRSPALQSWGRQLGHGDLLGEVVVGVGGCALGSPWGGRDVQGAVDRAELDSLQRDLGLEWRGENWGLCVFSWGTPPSAHTPSIQMVCVKASSSLVRMEGPLCSPVLGVKQDPHTA